MGKSYETKEAIWWAKERVDIFVEVYEKLIEQSAADKEEAKRKGREYTEGVCTGNRMSYKMFVEDLAKLKHDIEAIEKAMA